MTNNEAYAHSNCIQYSLYKGMICLLEHPLRA